LKFGSIFVPLSPIYVEDLVGDKISILSKHGPIEGAFNASTLLAIKTSNSPIKAMVNAFKQDNAVAQVKVKTQNGRRCSPLSTQIAQISKYENQTSGAFVVKHVRPTRHSRSTLRSTPHVRSVHYQVARPHTLAHVEVVFKLHTSTFPAVISYDDDVEDPAGRGRRRIVNIKLVGRGAKTCAWWTLRGFLRMRKWHLLGRWKLLQAVRRCVCCFELRMGTSDCTFILCLRSLSVGRLKQSQKGVP